MLEWLEKINAPEWLCRIWVHIVYYIIWPCVLFSLVYFTLFFLPNWVSMYIGLILACWITSGLIDTAPKEERDRLYPPPPIELILKKDGSIERAPSQSDQ